MKKKREGVLCGADQNQEWLLPWWWSRYTDCNRYPVVFCDFGMSQEARSWCKERGDVIDVIFNEKGMIAVEEIPPGGFSILDKYYKENLAQIRSAWFKKPFALLKTPFQKTIWIDLDCEVLASISPLFNLCKKRDFLGLLREPASSHLLSFDPQILYNSGVVIYAQNLEKIQLWAQEAMVLNKQFWSGDLLLSHLISSYRWEIEEIPEIWNWRASYGINLNVQIAHWIGDGGKQIIKQTGGIKPLLYPS